MTVQFTVGRIETGKDRRELRNKSDRWKVKRKREAIKTKKKVKNDYHSNGF